MLAPDYRSHELNLYFADNSKKFRVLPFLNDPETGSCFELKTTNSQNVGNDGIYIEYLMTNTNHGKLGVGATLSNLKDRATTLETGLVSEISSRTSGDAKNASDLAYESGVRLAQVSSLSSQIAVEISARQTDSFNLDNKITIEANARSAADAVHTGAIASANSAISAEVAERKSEIVRVDARILQEIQTRGDSVYNEAQLRTAADVALSARCDGLDAGVANEQSQRISEITRVDGRIDFIQSNVDPAAIDSLTEIVNNFNVNGASYASRLNYLEAVVQQLLNKSQ
jgi:hypothetical protein